MSRRLPTPAALTVRRDPPPSGWYAIDPSRSSIEFVTEHLSIVELRGRLTHVRGLLRIAADAERSHVAAEIDAGSVSTGNIERDAYVRGPALLDVDRYPKITYLSRSVVARRDGAWDVDGVLTIRDVTRIVRMRVDVAFSRAATLGDRHVSFRATAMLDREEFGLAWRAGMGEADALIGRSVRVELAIEASPLGTAARAPAAGTPTRV